MKAIILSIGDELVLGQTVDTNSAWLSQRVTGAGLRPVAHVTVADDRAEIARAIAEAIPRCDVLLISGGLGPTEDDLTRDALADVMGAPLELIPEALAQVESFFTRLKRIMPERNKVQAMIPRGARWIENTCGTAPGLAARFRAQGSGFTTIDAPAPGSALSTQHPVLLYVMPGVPKEMKAMFDRSVLPELGAAGGSVLQRTLHTFGLGESTVAERLGDLMGRDRNPSVGTTVSNGYVSLRLNAFFGSPEEAQRQMRQTEAACRAALGDVIWGAEDQTLPEVLAALLLEHPIARRWAPAVCTAESCTGGLLAKYFTDVAGSSAYFRQGWVTYTNEAKQNELGVREETLKQHGAVSEPTVREMAEGAAARSGAPYALAISGVAGPGGGAPQKPVGTVCIALAAPAHADSTDLQVMARTFIMHGDREMVRDRAAKMALSMLRFHLLGKPMPV